MINYIIIYIYIKVKKYKEIDTINVSFLLTNNNLKYIIGKGNKDKQNMVTISFL